MNDNLPPVTPLQWGIGAILIISAAAFILGPLLFGIVGI